MKTTRDILDNIIDEQLKGYEIYSKICEVISVNETERTCKLEPLDGDADIEKARLQASLSGSTGFVCIPTVGSNVVATFIMKELAFVSLFTDVDKILIDTDLVQFNGGDNSGLIKIEENVSKLNKIEGDINNLKSIFQNWTVAPTDGGLALKIATNAFWAMNDIVKTKKSDLEDTKITH